MYSKHQSEIYNAQSNRLKGYDYSSDGAYFLTICTKDHENYFGKIVEGEMVLNDAGRIIQNEISDIWNHFNTAMVDEFMVMPNHVHIIIIIQNYGTSGRDVSQKHLYDASEKFTKPYYSSISPKKWTIGNIIKLIKWFTSKKINVLNQFFFAWQPNYHDHIIRDEHELNRIRQYVINNPAQWEDDENYRK